MNARTLLLAGVLTGLATPSALAAATGLANPPIDQRETGVVQIHEHVRKLMGRCTYTANIVGHYQSTGGSGHRVSDVVVDIDATLQCTHQAPISTSRGVFFAATTVEMLTQHVRDAATLQYSPRRGTTCVAAPTMRTESSGPLFADLTMTCFANALATH